MVRLLLLLLNLLTTDRPRAAAGYPPDARYGEQPPAAGPGEPPGQPAPRPWETAPGRTAGHRPSGHWPVPDQPARVTGGRRPRHPLSRWLKWTAVALVAGLVFRRVVASVVLMALSATLHFAGFNVHLPHISLAWPWQTISAGTTTNFDLGPWVLQKIEGISRPALG
ncbi:MAG TPA: hypothetical protein VG123_15040, partial [Streptosporangiaceae bacterium]|nr:hypothetical protein [Streptosporangiaceae bacterium]